MARRPKGSILRTQVIQSKVTPKVHAALKTAANQEEKSVSTTVQEMVEKGLSDAGFLEND